MQMAKRAIYAVATKVSVIKTRQEIEHELTRFGATSFAYASFPDRASIMFEYRGRRVRFDLSFGKESSQIKTDRLHRQLWRALLLSIKAKLVSVQCEIETFEEAFLAHVVLADGRLVADTIAPQIEEQYKTGRVGPLMLEGPRK
jgi:hypothetical protein